MTNEELRAIDAEVHTKVMGGECFEYNDFLCDGAPGPYPLCVPDYSSNMQAAWLVVEKLYALKGMPVQVSTHGAGGAAWVCEVGGLYAVANAPTAPLAICRAALRAVEGKE